MILVSYIYIIKTSRVLVNCFRTLEEKKLAVVRLLVTRRPQLSLYTQSISVYPQGLSVHVVLSYICVQLQTSYVQKK